jgi:hypothetical protein
MGRLVSPPLDELENLRTPLQPGELQVLDLFRSELDDEWEIYIQPHLNGDRPDFVLLNPSIGIAVFEVKDWQAPAYKLDISANGSPVLVAKSSGKPVGDPVRKIRSYKRRVQDLYCARLDDTVGWRLITSGLIFTKFDHDDIEKLILPLFAGKVQHKGLEPLSGREVLDAQDIRKIFPQSTYTADYYMSEALANDLRSWLIEPDYSAEQRQLIKLDAQQQYLSTTRTRTGYRRIRGAAGSGKSVTLVARAMSLADEGKSVLVVGFNITLTHYLRDLCARLPDGHANAVTWLNFHEWCKCVAEDLEIDEYKETWSVRNFEKTRFDDELGEILNEKIPSIVSQALASNDTGLTPIYDAVLVDEAQDFQPLWWQALKGICKQGGEMVLVSDTTQDVYGHAKRWTDEAMTGAGFSGAWVELETSYRLPRTLAKIARRFLEEHQFETETILPFTEDDQDEFDIFPCIMKWVQVDKKYSVDACIDEMLALIREDDENSMAFSDLTLITDKIPDGRKIVNKLDEKGIRVLHTFPDSADDGPRKGNRERSLKLGFRKGDARVKATTMHSFKGWEGRSIILNISKLNSDLDTALFYTGLTRVKRHQEKSFLTVVCSEPKLEKFGSTWANFVKRD